MPRTRSLAWAELKIGLITIFAIVMTLVLIFLLSGEGGFSWQQYGLKTTFDNIAGLKPGAPVRVAGVEIGAVTETPFIGDRV
jgi:phospholipid/cholesterol/gamma-HCH transport system substrate-binding protein